MWYCVPTGKSAGRLPENNKNTMGCNFNVVVVPKKVSSVGDVKKYYKQIRKKLDGPYTGTLGSDNGEVVVHEEINLELPGFDASKSGAPRFDLDGTDEEEVICDTLQQTEAEKWGPTIALRVNGRWIFAGFYSD